MSRRILSVILALCTVLTLTPITSFADDSGLSNFQKNTDYTNGQFYDVKSGSWYEENVKKVCEYGLMVGQSDGRFNPEGNLTFAESIVLASRLYSIYHNDGYEFRTTSPWYDAYVNYAEHFGIINEAFANGGAYDSFNDPIGRADFAIILSGALPDEALPEINTIDDYSIPDVLPDEYYGSIYKLYKAGILTGNDEKGTLDVYNYINRSAASAIISRMADPSLRKRFTLNRPAFEPVPLNQLANLKSLRKKATDAQLAQAYDVAKELISECNCFNTEVKAEAVNYLVRQYFEEYMTYSSSDAHYNDPYGYFVLKSASCAGCVRATGMCLNMLGIPYEHVNENKNSHQWCRINVDGTYWIVDPYGLYCGPELEPYKHPNPFLS